MNELLFFSHVLLVVCFGLAALKLGKEALTAWISLQAVFANLFVIKQIYFFGFHITCSDVFAIGSIFGLNLLQEYYGKNTAKKALWICLFSMLFFALMSQVHLFYSPSDFDTTHSAFKTILSPSPRLIIASLAVFIFTQQLELRLFGVFKEKFQRIPLVFRNALSISTTQLLDTCLFSILGLWGIVSHLYDIIIISFTIKILVIILMSPLIQFCKMHIFRKEGN